jgi:hypothetical protein
LEILPARVTRTWTASAKASIADRAAAASSFSASYVGEADDRLSLLPYQEAWAHSSSLLKPDDGASERRRDFSAKTSIDLNSSRVGFSAAATADSQFNATLDTRTDKTDLKITIPMRLGITEASLGLLRSFSFSEIASTSPRGAGDAFDDARAFSLVAVSAAPLWKTIPVATLADSGLPRSFREASGGSVAASFRDGIESSLKLPKSAGWTALVLPATANLSVARSFNRTLETTVDSIETSASVQFSAVNLFGAFGTTPYFSFYKSDEITHSVSVSADFPKQEEAEWEIGFRQSVSLFGFTDARFTFTNNLRTGSKGWNEGGSLSWTAPQEKSLMKTLFRLMLGKAAGWKNGPLLAELSSAAAEAEHRETVELAVSASEDVSWSWAAKHESILKAAKKLTWITFASIGAAGGRADGERVDTKINATIGLSLNLRF